MYKLTLDTLNEARLLKAVDYETFRLGEGLFSRGHVRVTELTELNALCNVLDKRNYEVAIKISKNQILLKCGCQHANRGLICEHEVAAWLAVRDQLRLREPPIWRQRLTKIMDSVQTNKTVQNLDLYLLYFSLQKGRSTGSDLWKIIPYQLRLSDISDDILRGMDQSDPNFAENLITYHPELIARLKPVYFSFEPSNCLNCSPIGIRYANLIMERERSSVIIHHASFPLEDYLTLIADTGIPLFIAEDENPLRHSLQVSAISGQLQLRLQKSQLGVIISMELSVAENVLRIAKGSLEVISFSPLWILVDKNLFQISGNIDPGWLSTLQEWGELFIPTSQEQEFLDRYYLPLARQIPLTGEVVSWKSIDTTPTPRIYLSDHKGELLAQLRFGYGDLEVDYNHELPGEEIQKETDSWTLLRVQRRPESEKASWNQLSSKAYGLKRAPLPAQQGYFRLRERTHPVDFLLNAVPRLARDGFEVYGEEKLKTARVNRNTPSISFNVSSGIDWFDVKTIVTFGDVEVSIKEIRRALRKKERYIKLADGSIGEIPEGWFEEYKHLFALGEPSGENLRFSRFHLTLIDQALQGVDQVKVDSDFEHRRQRLRALVDGNYRGIHDIPLPQGFIGELRPYQKAGFDWLHFLHEFEFGGCLADDMGLGKTIQALVFLQSLYRSNEGHSAPARASLLVVPRSLLINWQREAARFTPQLRIMEYFATNREKDLRAFDQFDLLITTYGIMLRDIEFLHRYKFYYAILDESQSIKNPLSQTARAAHLLQAEHRLVLTGTPIENTTAEIWSQFAFLNPGLLGSLKYFKIEFGTPIEKHGDEEAAALLRKIVYPFILRRTKDQVAPELPPRNERILYSDMEHAQRKLYERTRDYYRGLVLGMMDSEGLDQSRIRILEGLLRLRQISNHPLLIDDKFRGDSGKFCLLLDTLETLQAEKHKALVFSQFVQMLRLVRQELDRRFIPYAYMDGHTQDRQERVDIFQNTPNLPFFLISLKAGGLGLNLTAADYVIHIDPWWNPAVETQASDRTHRIGQDKPVFVFKLISRDSVEEKILILQERKRKLVDTIITTESAFFKSLTKDDVKILFS